jgi:hypothetical protein
MKAGGWYNRKLQEKLYQFFREWTGFLTAVETKQILVSDIIEIINDPTYNYAARATVKADGTGSLYQLLATSSHKLGISYNYNLAIDSFRKRNHKIIPYLTAQDVQAALDKLSVERVMES